MKTKLLVILLLAGSSLFARTFVSVGIGVGGYSPYGYAYAPPPVYYAPPVPYYAPAPVYAAPANVWIPGYYYPIGARVVWHGGYWARPPYAGARWIGPRYYGGRYYRGYWRR